MNKRVISAVEISPEDIERTGAEYERVAAQANSVYRVVTAFLTDRWGQSQDMTDALTVLLITWNGRFYNPGLFDQRALEGWVKKHQEALSGFRGRKIDTLSEKDDQTIRDLFHSLLAPLQPSSGKWKGRNSPVSVAKALHPLAPAFFPAWDGSIAYRYDCDYTRSPGKGKTSTDVASEAYVNFCYKIREIAVGLEAKLKRRDKPLLLKQIDEYNYIAISLPSQQ